MSRSRDSAPYLRSSSGGSLTVGLLNMLGRYHERVEPLAQVSAPRPIIAQATSGALVLPAPVDYVAWTQRSSRFAERSDLKAPRRVAYLSGRMSPIARKEFTTRG